MVYSKKDAVTSQVQFGTIFAKSKKGIGAVVATSLLIVVAVSAIVSFQMWFSTYSSTLYGDAESKGSDFDVKVEKLIGNTLYFNSGKNNLSVNEVQINGVNCNISGNYSGIQSFDVSSCLENNTQNVADVVIFTKDKVVSSKHYVREVSTAQALEITGYNSTLGQWIGGTNADDIYSLYVDNNNNLYVGGMAGSDLVDDNLGSISGTYTGGFEGFVLKFDEDGDYQWGHWIGGSSSDDEKITSLIVDNSGNLYIGGVLDNFVIDDVGTINGTFGGGSEGFIMKFNNSGDYQWGQWIGGSSTDNIYSVTLDNSNNILVGGSATDDITDDGLGTINGTYSGGTEGFVLKFDEDGNHLWGQWLGGTSSSHVYDLKVDENDFLYVVGTSAAIISDDGLGTINGTHSGSWEGFMFKFNNTGDYELGSWFGTSGDDRIYSVEIDSSNNIFLGGHADGETFNDNLGIINGNYSGGFYEGLLLKLDENGDYLWGQWLGGVSTDNIYSISLDNSDNIYVGGSLSTDITDDNLGEINGNFTNDYDGFVFKFDNSGDYLWGQWLGSQNWDVVNALTYNELNERLYVGGYAQAEMINNSLTTFNGTYSGDKEGYITYFEPTYE